MLLPLILAAVIGYLLGSLPFGYLVAKAKGVNIFEVGSKSPGATNVRRVLGRGWGNFVLILDAFKGWLATAWALVWMHWLVLNGMDLKFSTGLWTLPAVAGLVAAILGHSYSCFTKFRGGKGVATAAGGLLVLMPWVLALALAVWILTFKLSRYVSLASILAAFALPVSAFFLHEPSVLIGLAAVIALFVTLRHRANILRLLNGTENKFVKKRAVPDAPPP